MATKKTSFELLQEIEGCDNTLPYIFISYSSHDADRVYADVAEFQRRGYNIWLDEKNLDKTKTSWKKDALEAIKDYNCSLVVFYVSQHSLTSEPCLNELLMTIDEETKDIHFEAVKFICVDVEEIGNIVDTSRDIVEEIRKDSSLSKQDKAVKTQTLSRFMRIFFNSNNERVRIHPIDEPGRKTDYYLDIQNSFPHDAKCFPEKIRDDRESNQNFGRNNAQSREIPKNVSVEYDGTIFTDSEVPERVREALEIYRNLAEEGDVASQRKLGIHIVDDKSLKKYHSEGVKWLEKAADQEDSTAMNWLGWCYDNAVGVAQDYDMAVLWYKKAVDHGNNSAKRGLGIDILQGRSQRLSVREGLRYLEESAESGDKTAMNWLAWFYKEGKSVDKDMRKAEEWYRKAVDAGNTSAAASFGITIMRGLFDNIPLEEGIPYLEIGANAGDASALNWLSWCYDKGKGVRPDPEKTMEYLKKAVEAGSADAQQKLGRRYLKGEGVPEDHKKAAELLQKSADGGDSDGMKWLGWCYEKGLGVQANKNTAIYWYKKAGDKGDDWAQKARARLLLEE